MGRSLIVVVLAAALFGAAGWAVVGNRDYEVSVVLDSATNLVEGGVVQVKGAEAGEIREIAVRGGKAHVKLALESDFAPLRDGAIVRVDWKALLGERLVTVVDGPAGAAHIPDGGMLRGQMPVPMEMDQVLAALDKPTREHLVGVVRKLRSTVEGNEKDLNRSVRSAGPALQALGEVLQGLGTDGQAIRQLVTQLDGLVTTLNGSDAQVRNVIDQLSKTSATTAEQREHLAAALTKLPSTLRQANSTLGKVPGTADKAVPLLRDLAPATERLPSVASNLQPVLADLRPLVGELRPTLVAVNGLLRHTPGLLDSAHAVLPGMNSLLGDLLPALRYLRPYTPEAAGFLANWGSATANYDSNGHYARIYIQSGLAGANVNPGVVPPGYDRRPDPMPGELVDQPWKDAFGSGVR
ncbi:MAG: MlaD family protein [Haloechinothrix sp.]